MSPPSDPLDPTDCETYFSAVYDHHAWGRSPNPNKRFFSGSGSYSPAMVDPYVAAVSRLMERLGPGLSAVDLGCGDFAVGSRLVSLFDRFTALDVVPALIEENRRKFAHLPVQFAVHDLTKSPPPPADVAILRQVLQHLSNSQIRAILQQIKGRYRHLIVSDSHGKHTAKPNYGRPDVPHAQVAYGTSIVLSAPPFNLDHQSVETLLTVPERQYVIVTEHYTLG